MPHASSSGSNAMRGKSSPPRTAEGSEERKHKRKRAAYSCTECTKAKAKCDRQQPCARCVSRRVPNICHYLVNGYEDPIELSKDVQNRLIRIESLLLQSLPSRSRPLEGRSLPKSLVESTPSSVPLIPIDRPKRTGYVTRGRYYGPSAMAYVGDDSAIDIMRALDVPDPETPEVGDGEDKRPPRALVDILHELPQRTRCDELIQLYFDNINLTRYPLRRGPFMQTYEALWQGLGTFSLDTWVIHRLPLVFIILAISALSAPLATLHIDFTLPASQANEKRLAKASELYQASRRASAYSDSLASGRGDIILVMSDLLTVRYLILTRRAPDALPALGTAVFRAQALEPPLNLDSENIVQPMSILTLNTFLICRHSLAHIMSRIAEEAYQLGEPSYDVIDSIEDALQDWASNLPSGLRLKSYGQSDDDNVDASIHPALIIHRHFASTEFNFARISLHRPYLARPDPDNQYARSREACLQAAMDDLWARTKFTVPGMDNLSTGSYRVTNSLIILGLSLLSNPSPDTLRMIHQCLSDFMTARKGNSNLLDEVKIKEIAMMEMLRSKTGQGLSRANSRAPSPHAHVHANAALSSTLTADEGQSQATLPATEPNASNLAPISDPSVQSMFDQFWGLQPALDLYGGGPFGTYRGDYGEISWDNFSTLIENVGGDAGGWQLPTDQATAFHRPLP
ncbi:nuclear protein [Cryptococcus gattii EJB2]|uniref:Nuclear protein n=1 Tax=Cryptococcus gattii EJB2 TaxID=1296103 RepID=A0ABR5BPS2_9TREE|nr:nuclear protein [Cryptococcus gattii EJB2]